MEKMLISEAGKSEFDDVLHLNTQIQQIHANAFPRIFKSASFTEIRLWLEKELLKSDTYLYVGRMSKKIIGYLLIKILKTPDTPFRYTKSFIYIDHIIIDQEYRNNGLGKQFIEFVRTLARENGVQNITSDVWDFNGEASLFFRSQGFKNSITRMELDL